MSLFQFSHTFFCLKKKRDEIKERGEKRERGRREERGERGERREEKGEKRKIFKMAVSTIMKTKQK